MMQFRNIITCVDAHTVGEPFRIVTSGIPPILGDTILEKIAYFKENLDDLRKLLMLEPRGHSDMYGGVIVPPVTPDGDIGILFMHNEGHGTMCGHGCIAVSTVVFETGMRIGKEGVNILKLDTPAGRVTAYVEIQGGRVGKVSFDNVPTFIYMEDISVNLDGIGEVSGDIVYGGDFYVFVDADKLGLDIVPEQSKELARRAMEIKYKALEKYNVVHPENPKLNGIYGTLLTTQPKFENNRVITRNICVFANGEIDRSPCGTGTSARLTQLYMRGVLEKGMMLEHHSIINTVFEAVVKKETTVADKRAIIPTVSGRASIMGFNQFVLDDADPLPKGFHL
jgi:proline racemase